MTARAKGPKRKVIVLDPANPVHADALAQLADDTPVSAEEVAAHMRWLRGGQRARRRGAR